MATPPTLIAIKGTVARRLVSQGATHLTSTASRAPPPARDIALHQRIILPAGNRDGRFPAFSNRARPTTRPPCRVICLGRQRIGFAAQRLPYHTNRSFRRGAGIAGAAFDPLDGAQPHGERGGTRSPHVGVRTRRVACERQSARNRPCDADRRRPGHRGRSVPAVPR